MGEDTRMILEQLGQINQNMQEMNIMLEGINKKINFINESRWSAKMNFWESQAEQRLINLKLLELEREVNRIKRHLSIA